MNTPLQVNSAPQGGPTLQPPTPAPAAQPSTSPAKSQADFPSAPPVHPLFADSFKNLAQVSQVATPTDSANAPSADPDANLNAAQKFGLGIVKGAVETGKAGLSILDKTVGRGVNVILGKGFSPIQRQDLIDTTSHNTAESVGKGAEQILELLAMPEVGVEKAVGSVLPEFAKTSPKLFKAAELGVKALASGTENAALGQVHNSQTPGTDFAFGAAAPVIGAGISKLWENASSIIGKTFNLPKTVQTLFETPEGKTMFQQGVKEVAQNPQSPYLNLANEVSTAYTKAEKAVKQAYSAGIDSVKAATEGKTFNVVPSVSEINQVLKDGYGLSAKQTKAGLQLITDSTHGNPFSDAETAQINNLLNEISGAKGKSFTGLTNLQKRIDGYFDTNAFDQAKKTPFNSLVGKLSDIVDKKVAAVTEEVQPVMKDINSQYSAHKQVARQFGKKFIDTSSGSPQLAPGAESFLSNLLNKNKAVLQDNVTKKLEEFTGVPILDRATGIRAATDMSALAGSGKTNTAQRILKNAGMVLGYVKGGIEGGFAGRKAGEVIGSVVSPNTGLKAIGAVDKASQVISKLPAKTGDVIGAAAKVLTRGGN